MDKETRDELIQYLDEWLRIWDFMFVQGKGYLIPKGNEPSFKTAELYNSLLEELIAEDVDKSNL